MHRTACTSGMAGRTFWGVMWRLMILRLHGGGTWESSSARAESFWTRALCSPLPPGPGVCSRAYLCLNRSLNGVHAVCIVDVVPPSASTPVGSAL